MNAVGLGLVCLLLSASGDKMGVPLGIPPLPEDPVLAHIAPADCVFYTSWTGAGTPDAKGRSQTEQLLAEPEMQHLFKRTEAGIRKVLEKAKDPLATVDNGQMMEGVKMVLYHPTAIFVSPWKLKEKKKGEAGGEAELDYDTLKAGLVCSLGNDVDRFKTDWATTVKILTEPIDSPKDDSPTDAKKKDQKGIDGRQSAEEKPAEKTNVKIAATDNPSKEIASGEKAKEDAKQKAEKEADAVAMAALEFKPIVEKIEIEGQPWLRIQFGIDDPKVSFGFHEGYFIAACGEKTAEEILERMKKGETPNWWKTIGKQTPIERRSTVTYLDCRAFRELLVAETEPEKQAEVKANIEMIGLTNASSLTEVSGLEGEDFVFKTRLNFDGDVQGLLQLVSDKPLKAEDLASIPRDSTLAMAARFDLKQAIEKVKAAAEKMNPATKEVLTDDWEIFGEKLSFNVRQEMINSLGDRWCLYNSPGEGGLIATGMTVVVALGDKEAFGKAYQKIIALVSKDSDKSKPNLFSLFLPTVMKFHFEDRDIYYIMTALVSPSWCVTDKEVIISLTPQNIKAFLLRGADFQSLGQMPGIAQMFEGEKTPVALWYVDTPKLFELGYPLFTANSSSLIAVLNLIGVEADLGMIPSQIAIGRHLRPTTFALSRSEDSLELTTRGTFPTAGPLLSSLILTDLYLDGDLDDVMEELAKKE